MRVLPMYLFGKVIQYAYRMPLCHQFQSEVRPDETSSPCDQYMFHINLLDVGAPPFGNLLYAIFYEQPDGFIESE